MLQTVAVGTVLIIDSGGLSRSNKDIFKTVKLFLNYYFLSNCYFFCNKQDRVQCVGHCLQTKLGDLRPASSYQGLFWHNDLHTAHYPLHSIDEIQ